MLNITGLVVAASMVVGQAGSNAPEDARRQMEYAIGDWKVTEERGDETRKGTFSVRWSDDKECVTLKYKTDEATGTGIGGWNPVTEELVENWYNPIRGHVELRYKLGPNKGMKGLATRHLPDGTTSEGEIIIEVQDGDTFTAKEITGDKTVVSK